MFHLLVREFLAVCDYLVRKGTKVHKGYLLIEKEAVCSLLDKNRYETAANKLKCWKEMGWIDTEENRLTKRIYVGELKKYLPYVKINLQCYECMSRLGAGKKSDE